MGDGETESAGIEVNNESNRNDDNNNNNNNNNNNMVKPSSVGISG